MDKMINEINNSLKKILDTLAEQKVKSEVALSEAEHKIAEKIDEAKTYKSEVESTKAKIKALESEIANLEVDLSDLNDRFGKKDLNAIVEAGNREINSKIMDKQNQITKHRQKIGELTEKARSIKDLLINLRKDKTLKEERLEIITKAYNYYNESLNKIIEFAKDNPNSLDTYVTYTQPYDYEYNDNQMVESEIFAEIESMDKEDEDDSSETRVRKALKKDNPKEEVAEELALDDIYEKLKAKTLSFDSLSNSLDKEYDSIFGSEDTVEDSLDKADTTDSFELNSVEEPAIFETTEPEKVEPEKAEKIEIEEKPVTEVEPEPEPETAPVVEALSTDFATPDFFGGTAQPEENPAPSNDNEIVDFLKANDLDFDQFKPEDQVYLKNVFNDSAFKQIIDVIKENHININNLYAAANILSDTTADELSKIIGKLLLAGQTTENIGYVLNRLSSISSYDLNEVINSYPNTKDVNITELINKARALNDKAEPIDINVAYLSHLGFMEAEMTAMQSSINKQVLESLTIFEKIVTINYNTLNAFGISNIKAVFTGHTQMFLMNPDRFDAIFAKYDQADLVRCIEKNAAVVEKL